MNRLIEHIELKKRQKEKLFCAYLTLGYPNLQTTRKLIVELEKIGTDILELGFPFSDPLADGRTIQMASEAVLRRGVQIEDAFQLIKLLRLQGLKIPVLFFSYFNPVVHFGVERFAREAKKCGFDGLVIPDLSLEESESVKPVFHKAGLSLVYLIAPTTKTQRMKAIASHSDGFIYYVSVRGVTGARKDVPEDLIRNVKTVKRLSPKPVLVGFGVSSAEQAHAICLHSDGVIVGSGIISALSKSHGSIKNVLKYVSDLIGAVKGR